VTRVEPLVEHSGSPSGAFYDDGVVTIYHGDSREILADGLQGGMPKAALVTDPPYGMAFRSGMGGAFGTSEIAGDEDPTLRDHILELWGDAPAIVFGRWSVPRPANARMVLTWEKGNHVGMGDLSLPWKPNTEEVYILGDGFAGHRGSSVLRHLAIAGTVGQAAKGTRRHPTEKPVSLMIDLLLKCPKDWLIVDPFMGSGSTLRAAKDLGRRAIGIEIRGDYCQAAAERMCQEVLDVA